MFRDELTDGPPRELRNQVVIDQVIAEPQRVGALFDRILDGDPIVRMRAADALEKVCRHNPAIVAPLTQRILEEMSAIEQPSVQWHFAQIVGHLPLAAADQRVATSVVRGLLDNSDDWIVLSHSMETLASFAEAQPALKRYLAGRLAELSRDRRPAVAKRASRLLARLTANGADATRSPARAPTRSSKTQSNVSRLRVDPIPALLACGHPAVVALTRRDLLDDRTVSVEDLWELPEPTRLLKRQLSDGRWRYPNPKPEVRTVDDYDQLETYRQLAVLVHKYGLDHRHPAVERASLFLASFQSDDGDYRGIYGRQYTPNYSAAITELLITVGYADSRPVEATLRWLHAMRQNDGGWAIPTRTRGMLLDIMRTDTKAVEPDREAPSSHLITGIVLRALAAHPDHRRSPATRKAGRWLKSRFFLRDHYPDHAAASYWTTYSYPFWWTDLLSALTTLIALGFRPSDPDLARGLAWFVDHQDETGLWNPGRNRPKRPDSDWWVALAVCRMLRAAGRL